MSTGNKIVIGIMSILIISLLIGFNIKNTREERKSEVNNIQPETLDIYAQVLDPNAQIKENIVQENKVEDVINSNYVGQEEGTEVTTETVEEQVINKVKKAYGTTDGVYFHIKHQDGNMYDVAVTEADSTVIMWYTVNMDTGTVLEN